MTTTTLEHDTGETTPLPGTATRVPRHDPTAPPPIVPGPDDIPDAIYLAEAIAPDDPRDARGEGNYVHDTGGTGALGAAFAQPWTPPPPPPEQPRVCETISAVLETIQQAVHTQQGVVSLTVSADACMVQVHLRDAPAYRRWCEYFTADGHTVTHDQLTGAAASSVSSWAGWSIYLYLVGRPAETITR